MLLRRILGTGSAIAIPVGIAIGSGIFRTPGEVAKTLPAAPYVLAAWVVGGLVYVLAALVLAELATRLPKAGGEFAYLRSAYGDFPAFFFGWAYTIVIAGGGIAGVAVVFGEYAAKLLFLDVARASGPIGAAAIAALVFVNVFGLRAGSRVQDVLTIAKVAILAGVIGLGFLGGDGRGYSAAASAPPSLAALPVALAAAFQAVFWTFDGSNDVVKMAEEVKDPRKTLPRALLATALTLTLLYVGVNAALLYSLTPGEMGASIEPASDLASRVLGPRGAALVTAATALVLLGAVNANLVANPRVPFALARERMAPRFLATVSARQTPTGALLAVGVLAVFFTLARDFAEILSIYTFAGLVLWGLAYSSIFVLRLRDTRGETPAYLSPLYPVAPAILVATHAALAAGIAIARPREALESTALLAVGAVFFLAWKWRNARAPR